MFIVLVSPGFFLERWPVLELRAALRRAAQSPAAITVMPLYVRWTRRQADQTLQQAAAAGRSRMCSGFTRADGSPVKGAFRQQPSAEPSSRQQPAAQAFALLQQLQRYQQANAQRRYLEHAKEYEVQAVEELVREALRAVPRRDFGVLSGMCASALRLNASARRSVLCPPPPGSSRVAVPEQSTLARWKGVQQA